MLTQPQIRPLVSSKAFCGAAIGRFVALIDCRNDRLVIDYFLCSDQDDLGIDVRLPIQHREARILSYRAYATVAAFISLRVNLDESCEVTVIDTRTAKTWSISLSEAQVSAALGKSFLEATAESVWLSAPAGNEDVPRAN